jgi:two-component system, OmpR family, sensor histidine kinase VanS
MADATKPVQKDPILSHAAHEIRTPLSVILGYLQMLIPEKLGPTTEAQQKAFGEIKKTAGKIKDIADEMTDLGLLLAGGAEFNRRTVDLPALIEQTVGALAPQVAVQEREIRIRLVDDARDATIHADARWLQRAFKAIILCQQRELMTSDELLIAIERVTHDTRPAFRVTIAGADRIQDLRSRTSTTLEPFAEVRASTGLSLFIARQVIEAHGGQIVSRIEPREYPSMAPLVLGAVLLLPAA